jgi:hypothetical protein
MIKHWNFDGAAGFCPPILSDKFRKYPSASHTVDLVSGMPETSED